MLLERVNYYDVMDLCTKGLIIITKKYHKESLVGKMILHKDSDGLSRKVIWN